MATLAPPRPTRPEPAIETLLGQVRARIRAYLCGDTIAAVLVVLGASFWISFALDWLFEPPRPLRVLLLAAVAVAVAYTVYRFLLSRIFVRLEDRHMALLLERRFSGFHDALLTAVEISDDERAAGFNPQMLARTRREAVSRATQVDLKQVFNSAPLVRRGAAAAALVIAAALLAIFAPQAFGVWARRSLLMSDELWPRLTRLEVVGFDADGRIKIARGSDWQLLVRADAALDRRVPEIVEVRYSTSDGARGRENMRREGIVAPGEAAFQDYAHTFKSVLTALEFYVVGGDAREGPYFLDVVDSPTISRMTAHCEYPPYMRREPRDFDVARQMQLPRGTQITLEATTNKPLVSVRVDQTAAESAAETRQINVAEERGEPAESFRLSLARLDADTTLLFTLVDADGIRSREPIPLSLGAIADEPPQVDVRLKGIGTAITPAARLPVLGEVSDDYGVAKVWFAFHVDAAPPREQPFGQAADNAEKLAVADVLEVRDLQLVPKQKLHLVVQAADGFGLEGGPNVGSGQSYVLDVVTAEQLRSMLEARELTLRRRFETIVAELTDSRNLLTELEAVAGQKPAVEAAAPAAEPGDAKEAAAAAARKADPISRTIQVERVLQNGQRSSHETMQVALAFDDIFEELLNNRVDADTEQFKVRLKDGIADPLKAIVSERFPKLEAQLKELSSQLDKPPAAATRAAAIAQMDLILVEMRQVLDKMLELETFNEVLDMLRQIIDAQEKVNAETKQIQKQKLRDLVE